MYAYYQPLTEALLLTVNATSVNVRIGENRSVKVSEIDTDENLCSSFSMAYSSRLQPIGK